jgi:hypothetical protein
MITILTCAVPEFFNTFYRDTTTHDHVMRLDTQNLEAERQNRHGELSRPAPMSCSQHPAYTNHSCSVAGHYGRVIVPPFSEVLSR